jgi:two-component system OmpR family sensor kinase
VRPEPTDVDALVHETLRQAERLADRDWGVLSSADGFVAALDAQRITQALLALADNAVAHTGPGDRIVLGATVTGGVLRLRVADTGSGVADADRERIFARFARGSGSRRSDGAGLGLAIVRAIAEAHGGHVELDSREGAGSTFTLVIPAEPSLQEVT